MPTYSAAHFITQCFPPIMTLAPPAKILRPRSIPVWTQLTCEWAQCSSPIDVTSLLHLVAPPAPAPQTPTSSDTPNVWLGEATLDKAGEESRRHWKTELKASVWIPRVPWRQ